MKKVLLATLVIPALSGCKVVTIPEIYPYPFNVDAGDRLDVIMEPINDPTDRCDHMGGELIYDPSTNIFTCEGVDF
jgi:hypothetical protein